MAVNGIDIVGAVVVSISVEGLCGTRPIRGCLALHWGSDDRGEKNRRRVVGGRVHRRGRKTRSEATKARSGKGAIFLRARARGPPQTTSKAREPPRRNDPSPPLA